MSVKWCGPIMIRTGCLSASLIFSVLSAGVFQIVKPNFDTRKNSHNVFRAEQNTIFEFFKKWEFFLENSEYLQKRIKLEIKNERLKNRNIKLPF